MKRFATLCIGISLATVSLNAQKNEVTNCYMAFSHYQSDKKDVEELLKAKTAIDKATLDAGTSTDPKTWMYRGQVYLALYQKDYTEHLAAHKDVADPNKKGGMAYYETPTDSLIDATNSFLKSQVLNVKQVDIYIDGNTRGLGDCYYALQNVGIQRYNKEEYAKAFPMFNIAADISTSHKIFDTLNIGNAALAAYNAKMYPQAIANYKKLTDAGAGGGHNWTMLGRAYVESGDSASYIKAISDGLKKYPSNADLLTEDVNIKMNTGHSAEAIAELNALIQQRPNDSQLNAVVGNVYDKIANPDSANGHHAPKPKNYEEMLAKAVEYYKKAIEIDPKNFDANYNLGVLYYNQSVYYYEQSELTIADAAKYKTMWEKPLPDAAKYLEAAHALEPKDMTTLLALKACYGQMGDNDNYTRIKEEIKKVQAGG